MAVPTNATGSAALNGIAPLLPISDTVNGNRARESPGDVIAHYERLADRLWLPPQLEAFSTTVLESIGGGKSTWASLTGPYGFGKTASGILLWRHARDEGFLAIPPLSCTNYDEFAGGVAALAEEQAPKEKARVRKLFQEIWTESLDRIARTEAKRYELPVRKVRTVLKDQLEHGRWAPDGHSHRLVEFLSRLGELSVRWSRGLVVIVDELQQLLGPLDVSTLSRLREFVWGMRTEQTPCAVVLTLDTQLEARLGHWAADLLHRVREHSPALQMTGIFTRDFPRWLWERLTSPNGRKGKVPSPAAITPAVLDSLGQFVERPDLANGPRTVVDVINRAAESFAETGKSYDIPSLVDDLHKGRFRFFGEGTPVQRTLTQLLSDAWVQEDAVRCSLVRTLAAFPCGCPSEVIAAHVGNGRKLKTARDELFGPLLVELPGGLALEPLQQVLRGGSEWEHALARCWDTMPAVSALAEAVPELVSRVLLPKLFCGLGQANGEWAFFEGDTRVSVAGFKLVRGSFDPDFPVREVAVWVGQEEPPKWPEDVDLCLGFICEVSTDGSVQPGATITNLEGAPRVILRMPTLVPFDGQVPPEIARYHKYIQPEPLRPAYVLLGLGELQAFAAEPQANHAGNGKAGKQPNGSCSASTAEMRKLVAFRDLCLDHLMRFLIHGEIDAGIGRPVRQRGPELIRALFSIACKKRYPDYQTLITARNWKPLIEAYRKGLASGHLTLAQRRGQEKVTMTKADAFRLLFNQTSTAAGDSFIRSLGPLVKVAATSEAWSIRFSLHPGEAALLEYLRGCQRARPVPLAAACEFLRHKGYVEDEAVEIVIMLGARELLTLDRSKAIRLVSGNAGLEDQARKRIVAAREKLERLGATQDSAAPLPAKAAELSRLADSLEQELAERVDAFRLERQGQLRALRTHVGQVRGTSLPDEWLKTELSTHFSGISDTLRRSQAKLVESLRKEADRIEQELAAADHGQFEWAARWVRRRESMVALIQRFKGRVTEFDEQTGALLTWVAANQELFAVSTLCEKVNTTDPAPGHELAQLLARMRERFSTASWEPLGEAAQFLECLRPTGQALQRLLYSQARAFYKELETLRCQFGSLLPATPAPEFETRRSSLKTAPGGYAAFDGLYSWAFSGFSGSFTRAKELKVRGLPWADPRQKKRSWNELATAIERALAAGDGALPFERVVKIGAQVSEILRGFGSDSAGVFDNPGVAPDFDAIREMYRRGEVVIRIEPRK